MVNDKEYTEEEWMEVFPSGSSAYSFYSVNLCGKDAESTDLFNNKRGSVFQKSLGNYTIGSASGDLVVTCLEDYFQDPINPTQEENALFMVEHNIDFRSFIESAKRRDKC